MKTLLVGTLLLTGCAAFGTTTRVEVPVSIPCRPPAIEAPSRPVDGLTSQANEFEFSRALWATLEVLEGYVQHLEAAIAVCRNGG